jgi:hypothetical protein
MKRGFIQKHYSRYGGNIYLDRDLNGWYEECLQCGSSNYMETMIEVRKTNSIML